MLKIGGLKVLMKSDKSGFTLIELLVVMLILSGVLSIVVFSGQALIKRSNMQTGVSEVLQLIRQQKRASIMNLEPAFLAFESNKIMKEETVLLSLSGDISLDFEAAFRLKEKENSARNKLSFYPDGSTNGGVLKIVSGESVRYLNIRPLLGGIDFK